MRYSALLLAVLLAALCCSAALAQASPLSQAPTRPFLSRMFQDNMVLQRDIPLPVWGWALPGAKVTVRINGRTASGVADADGRWEARLEPMPAGGPFIMTVEGPHLATLNNVLVGDVWVCSGQSNMEFGLSGANNAAQEMAEAKYPKIRLFHLQRKVATEPQLTAGGTWEVCSPELMARTNGAFSAVAYFFGRKLHRDLKVPIGLIDTSWGGTIIEAWTSAEGLSKVPFMAPAMQDLARNIADQKAHNGVTFEQRMDAWWKKNDPGSSATPDWSSPSYDASSWKTMNVPVAWEEGGLPNYDGVVWFRRDVVLPDSAAGKEAVLNLGPVDDRDTTFVNGVAVGGLNDWITPRVYRVPAGVLKAGRNVIAVRVLDTGGAGGFTATTPDQMHLDLNGEAPLPLSGAWLYSPSVTLDKVAGVPQRLEDNPNIPTVLYNGMIQPIVPFGIKGAIWYQGESNAGTAYNYRTLMPAMITDWRTKWGEGDFPFYMVQLANYTDAPAQPGDSDWAELREAQLLTAQTLPHTGMAVIIDIGEAKDIHPKNKQDVGKRLALAAEATAYGRKVEGSGPVYRETLVEGDKIRLFFDHVGGGLVAKNGPLTGFSIAGKDRKFVWADAKIDGDTVVVSSPQVPEPVAVRYAWANNPVCNLYNKADLPATPFRTDAWKGITGGPDGPDVAPRPAS